MYGFHKIHFPKSGTIMQSNKKYYTIGAISKTCALLETLSMKKAWELAELSKTMKMPKTTVHRILLTLQDEGYVIQEQKGRLYSLTYKLFSLGRKVISYTNIIDVARPFIKELLDEFDETVNLCVASGVDMLIIDKVSTTQALRPDNIVGSSFPIFYSASGKAFCAFYTQSYFTSLLETMRKNVEPPITEKSLQIFLEEITHAQKTGLAYDNEEIFKGVKCISVPIFDITNLPVAAFSISIPSVRLTKKIIKNMEKKLLLAAERLSCQLGSTHILFSSVP